MFDVEKIREDFPILSREISGRPLIYLDNGATSQTPKCVVDHIADTYYRVNANVHRGVHTLSQEATDAHEAARRRVQQFIGAGSSSEIIFTRGTTEAINLVASSFGDEFLHDGDEVILTVMEHHANIVPWQLLQCRRNIKLRVVPIDERGDLNVDTYKSLFNEHMNGSFLSLLPWTHMVSAANAIFFSSYVYVYYIIPFIFPTVPVGIVYIYHST